MSDEWKEGDQERRGPQRWRIKKEISLGDLIAFAAASLSVVYAYTTLDKRLAILEAAAVVQATVDNRQDIESTRYQQRIDESLRDINRKLDRLVERPR
jgi:hypothetical protein